MYFFIFRIIVVMLAAILTLCACGSSGLPAGSAPTTTAFSGSGSAAANTPASALPRDCFWSARSDPNAANVLYPDSYATYWTASLTIPAGGEVRLEGQYPQARYMSFNLYNPRLEPLDALADVEIAPKAGSNQPFAVAANRYAGPRDYAVRIIAGVRPDDPAQRAENTLYSFQTLGPQKVGSQQASIIYRIYVEDKNYDITGGVGLPTVVVRQANGTETRGNEACKAMEAVPVPNASGALNQDPAVETQPNTAAFKHVQWLKFFDLQTAQANRFNATQAGQAFRTTLGGNTNNAGGFASNVHNNYVYATVSQSLGTVAAFAATAPTTPKTRDNIGTMQNGQMRYFSICTNEANSTRYYDCAYDEMFKLDAQNRFVLAVSRAADRPINATPACGVTWLEWGTTSQSLLIYRHMLPVAKA
jgi:hypothetical protein